VIITRITSLLATTFAAGCSLFGIRGGWEQPPYVVIDQVGGNIEVRRYGPRLVAETIVEGNDESTARNEAFRILAAYIFGDNRTRQEVAMTAPVAVEETSAPIAMTAPVATTRAGAGRWSMRFFLPSELTLETAPEPIDPRVRIAEVPGETVAVLEFNGRGRPAVMAAREVELESRLAASPWMPAGQPLALFYDPPWTIPFFRRNEVAVPVMKSGEEAVP
jgi:hypothetical protein